MDEEVAHLLEMLTLGVLVHIWWRDTMSRSESGLIVLQSVWFPVNQNNRHLTFLLFSLKNVILSYSGRAQKFWASYQTEFSRASSTINTLSKKHCGRKDNLGRVLANCSFSEPKADTVSAFISMGLLDKLVMFDLHGIAEQWFQEGSVRYCTLQGASVAWPCPLEAVYPWSCNSWAVDSTKVPVTTNI